MALARHVAFLTITRVTGSVAHEVWLARREARVAAPDGLPRLAGVGTAEKTAAKPTGVRVSLDDAVREALFARDAAARDIWFDTARKATAPVLAVERRRREVEIEARARLGAPEEDRATAASATAFLERTRELTHAMVREAAKTAPTAGVVLEVALARGAGEGWPRAPSLGAISELFGPAARPAVSAVLTRAGGNSPFLRSTLLGASSWARALAHVGFAAHAGARSTVPFALRLGPEHFAAHRTARLVASSLASPAFHVRALGCGERVARGQARSLALVALLAARSDAARVSTLEPREKEELLFFASKPGDLAAVVPHPEPDAPARWRAWLALAGDLARVIERHDEDYFRNPRFWSEIAVRAGSGEEDLQGDPGQGPGGVAVADGAALAAELERRIA
jgi:hypothetical protein